jgi:hypothetical protein
MSRPAPCIALVRPGNNTIRREIVGIRLDLERDRLRLLDAVGDAAALGIGYLLFFDLVIEFDV